MHLSSRRRVGLVAVIALLLALVVPSAVTSSGAFGQPGRLLVSSKSVRPAYVAAVTDPEIVSMMADEKITFAEAQRRLNWQDQAPALAAELQDRLGEAFGGVWINPSTGRVKVGIVGSEASVRDQAGATIRQLGLAGATDLVKVRHPFSQLEAANSWLGSRLAQFAAGARGPLGSELRPDLNVVELQLPNDTSLTAAERAVVGEARVRYGDALLPVRGSPSVQAASSESSGAQAQAADDCKFNSQHISICNPPLRAGIGIYYAPQGGHLCTGGFPAVSRTDGKYYLFTAGHCFAGGKTGSWITLFADGSTHVIGSAHNFIFDKRGDMGILNVNNPTGWNPQPAVYVTGTTFTPRDTLYSITGDSLSVWGQWICKTGAITGTTCGYVVALGFKGSVGGVEVDNLGVATFCSQEGDSGGPVFTSHKAYGLVSATPNAAIGCQTYYQGIRAAENAMNVNVTWPLCGMVSQASIVTGLSEIEHGFSYGGRGWRVPDC
jgi:hypothetical protein